MSRLVILAHRFLPHDAMLARYAVVEYPSLSVRHTPVLYHNG